MPFEPHHEVLQVCICKLDVGHLHPHNSLSALDGQCAHGLPVVRLQLLSQDLGLPAWRCCRQLDLLPLLAARLQRGRPVLGPAHASSAWNGWDQSDRACSAAQAVLLVPIRSLVCFGRHRSLLPLGLLIISTAQQGIECQRSCRLCDILGLAMLTFRCRSAHGALGGASGSDHGLRGRLAGLGWLYAFRKPRRSAYLRSLRLLGFNLLNRANRPTRAFARALCRFCSPATEEVESERAVAGR
mmetsp:Transcript_12499/g.29777  ORF Transcript_12499/g.29777 Transcript_12499/m.29777 type:complete len:242 (-) Transcript_12499:155-880(-)